MAGSKRRFSKRRYGKKKKSVKKKRFGSKRRYGSKKKSVKKKRFGSKRRYGSKKRRFSKRRYGSKKRRFGSKGPGYKGATSFQNGYVNYFGAPEPFVNASEWFYPNPGGKGAMIGKAKSNYQSPDMVYRY